jgi:hypothetical protein
MSALHPKADIAECEYDFRGFRVGIELSHQLFNSSESDPSLLDVILHDAPQIRRRDNGK